MDGDVGGGGDAGGDAGGEEFAVYGEGVTGGDGGGVGVGEEEGVGAAHLLLEEPGGGVLGLGLEGVGADEFGEVGGLVGLGGADGAHLVEVDFAACCGGLECCFGTGEAATDDFNSLHRLSIGDGRGWCLRLLVGEGGEGLAGETHDAPLGLGFGSDGVVDVDGGLVPGEDVPFEAGAALLDGDAGEVAEKGFADSLPSTGGGDVEVFKTDAVVAEPGGVAGEVEGEANGMGGTGFVAFGDDAVEAGGGAEAVAEEVGFGG